VPGARLNGHPTDRLANNVNVSVPGVRGDDLVLALDKLGVAASAGAACGSQTWEPSHVLLAMGLSMTDAVGGLRLTLSPATTQAEIAAAVARLPTAVDSLRPAVAAG
jgi:cysteine desulfurase